MKKPIFAMIPSGYKASTLYTPIPINGDGDFALTRSTVATRINKDGLIEEVAANVPRLDYKDSNCPSLLIERASTNLMTDSSDFTVWNDILITVDSNAAIAPDGTIEADKVTRTSTSASYISDSFSKSASALTYTSSIFVKRGNTDELAIRSQGSYPARIDLRYNFETNDIYYVNPLSGFLFLSSNVENYPNGWVRLSWTYTTDAHTLLTGISLSPRLAAGNTDSTDTSNYAFCYVWNAQCEEAGYASTSIKTNGTAVTRNADLAISGDVSSIVNSKTGTMYAEMKSTDSVGTFQALRLSVGTSDNNSIRFLYSPTGFLRVTYRIAGVSTLDWSVSYNIKEYAKFSISWNEELLNLVVNGFQVASLATPSLNSDFDTVTIFNGIIVKDVKIWDEVLSESELIELTR